VLIFFASSCNEIGLCYFIFLPEESPFALNYLKL